MTDFDAPLTPLSYQILLALADGSLHGYGIIKEIESREGEPAAPSTGAMYLALQRMESEGLIEETGPPASEQKPDGRRRYYGLTESGRGAARSESVRLEKLVADARAKNLLTGDVG